MLVGVLAVAVGTALAVSALASFSCAALSACSPSVGWKAAGGIACPCLPYLELSSFQ